MNTSNSKTININRLISEKQSLIEWLMGYNCSAELYIHIKSYPFIFSQEYNLGELTLDQYQTIIKIAKEHLPYLSDFETFGRKEDHKTSLKIQKMIEKEIKKSII